MSPQWACIYFPCSTSSLLGLIHSEKSIFVEWAQYQYRNIFPCFLLRMVGVGDKVNFTFLSWPRVKPTVVPDWIYVWQNPANFLKAPKPKVNGMSTRVVTNLLVLSPGWILKPFLIIINIHWALIIFQVLFEGFVCISSLNFRIFLDGKHYYWLCLTDEDTSTHRS